MAARAARAEAGGCNGRRSTDARAGSRRVADPDLGGACRPFRAAIPADRRRIRNAWPGWARANTDPAQGHGLRFAGVDADRPWQCGSRTRGTMGAVAWERLAARFRPPGRPTRRDGAASTGTGPDGAGGGRPIAHGGLDGPRVPTRPRRGGARTQRAPAFRPGLLFAVGLSRTRPKSGRDQKSRWTRKRART